MISVQHIKNQGMNNTKELTQRIESLLYKATTGNYPDYWEEDIITLTVLKGIADIFGSREVTVPGNSIKTQWTLHMLNKDINNHLGDIAILATIRYHDGQNVEGVAAIKTAARDKEKNLFSSLKKDQIKKLNNNFHHSQILLYDYDHVTGMAFPAVPEAVLGNYPMNWNNWVPFTHGALVPAGLCAALSIKNTGLYKAAVPLSYQFCFRYFYGLDMDHGPLHLDIARGLKLEKGTFKYLLCLNLSHGNSEIPEPGPINREVYSDLE